MRLALALALLCASIARSATFWPYVTAGSAGACQSGAGAQSVQCEGLGNQANGAASTVGGGNSNVVNGNDGTISGGFFNTSSGVASFVGGGSNNTAGSTLDVIGGGSTNQTSGTGAATVGGGSGNNASASQATVGGGGNNVASAIVATVAGGEGNTASARAATVPGGRQNTASGINSFAAGAGARATSNGSFVWNGSTLPFGDPSPLVTNNDNGPQTFSVYAPGGSFFSSAPVIAQGYNAVNDSTDTLTLRASNATGSIMLLQVDGGFGGTFWRSDTFGDSQVAGVTAFISSGTKAVPAATLVDSVYQITLKGHDGIAETTGRARIQFDTTEDWTPTGNGTDIIMRMTKAGTTSMKTRLTIDENGLTIPSFSGYSSDINASGGAFRGLGINVSSNVVAASSITAGAFFGDGSHLTGLSGGACAAGGGANSVLCSGASNTAAGTRAVVSGGNSNSASATESVVAGGQANVASGASQSTVGGGYGNTASGDKSTVPGGQSNTASGLGSIALGGVGNIASGAYSVVAGQGSNANSKDGVFVFSDSTSGTPPRPGFTDMALFNVSNGMQIISGGGVYTTTFTAIGGLTVPGPVTLSSSTFVGVSVTTQTAGGAGASVTATCDPGTYAVGGGCNCTAGVALTGTISEPNCVTKGCLPTAWVCQDLGGTGGACAARVICSRLQ